MKSPVYSLLLMIFLPFSVLTQSGESISFSTSFPAKSDFQKFTNEDGLLQDTTFCILQDSRGFIWSGTWHGLSRFDGYQFVNYTKDFENPHSVSDNKINSVYETRNREIWIGTRNGLNRYDYDTNRFYSYKFEPNFPNIIGDSWVTTVFEDSSETLWVGTRKFGLGKFDRATEKFTFYNSQSSYSNPISDNNVSAISEDKNGFLWVATLNGLNKFDKKHESFTYIFPNNQTPNNLETERINAMLIDKHGNIWLGARNGLSKFNPQTDQFKHYKSVENNPNSLSNDSVQSIYETKTGVIWIGTSDGLNQYLAETDDFAAYKYDPSNPHSLGKGDVLSIIEDNLEQLWVGTSIGGLNKYNQKKSRFQQFRHENNPNSISQNYIFSIIEDKNKDLWVSSISPGLFKFYPAQNRFQYFDQIKEQVSALYADRSGKLWIGTPSEFYYFETDVNRLTPYKKAETGESFKNVSKIYQDRAENIWFGTSGEVFKIEKDSKTAKQIRYQIEPPNLIDYVVLHFFEDSQGYIWIGTRNSLTKLNPVNETFLEYRHEFANPNSLSSNDVGAIYEDTSGTLWFGTSSGGLNRFDRNLETFEHFTEREGLPINNIYEILEDEQNNLWLSTDKGLSRFNIKTRKFRNFDVNDGLPSNEFNDRAALKTSNGDMYFGTTDGLIRFNPKDFIDSQFVPPVYITAVRILEKPLNIEQNFSEMKELKLSWRDYLVSFDFAALDYTDPRKLQYQWKLEGFDKDWINGGTRRTATYTNLPGGEYTLKVKATNIDGVWTGETINLKIIVTPPFYQTLWFHSLIGIVLVILGWLLYRNRIQNLRAVNETQVQFSQHLIRSQETERKRIAQELHDSTAQNLFAMTVNLTKIERVNNLTEDKKRLVEESLSLGEQVMNEIRDISYLLHPPLLEQTGLTKTIEWYINGFSKRSEIEVEINIKEIERLDDETELALFRIMQECLTNIQKHSQSKTAEISLYQSEHTIYLKINDDGIGIEKANNLKDRDDKTIPKYGLGLKGIKQRIKHLQGNLNIKSDDFGTEIFITIPILKVKQ